MISLQVESYCQNCPKFVPECSKYSVDNHTYMTSISCANRGLCAIQKQYIEEQMDRRERPDYMTTCVKTNGRMQRMTKQEAVSMLEKEVNCFCTDISNCSHKNCLSCESNVNDYDLHEAMRVVIDILKEGEEDGCIVCKTLKDLPTSPLLDPKYKGETDGQS